MLTKFDFVSIYFAFYIYFTTFANTYNECNSN